MATGPRREADEALLGGKGAGLAEMSQLGIPVPPGFTITTEVCIYYQAPWRELSRRPARSEVAEDLARLEQRHGPDASATRTDPLLVSVRSGAAISMPGMMDTILNLGLNDEIVAGRHRAPADDARFLRDCYRRLLTMYGDVVLEVPHERFEKVLEQRATEAGRGDRRRAVAPRPSRG